MCLLLPIGAFFELSPEDAQKIEYETTKLDGDFCYALMVDYEIFDGVKEKTDDLPLSIRQKVVNFNDLSDYTQSLMTDLKYKISNQKSLNASHKPQENYLISLNFLQFYVKRGLKFEKVHKL